MTAPPVLTETDWARMSWHAKQQWLAAADKRRRALLVEVERAAARETTRTLIAHFAAAAGVDPGHYDVRRSLQLAREIRSHLPDDPDGPARLAALDHRSGDTAQADRYRTRNARRQATRRTA